MASWVFSSIQSLSTKVLNTIRGTTHHYQQDPASPVANQNEGVREDLEKLSRLLPRIQAVQRDAEGREIHDQSVQLRLAELRALAYQAEDVLDEFHYEVLRSTVESGDAAIHIYHKGSKRKYAEMYTSYSPAASSSTIIKASIPEGMTEKIRNILERFEEISKQNEVLCLREEDGTRRITCPQVRQPTSSHLGEMAVFGRENEKDKIINLLNPSNGPNFMVLPIVGMGGLGKTTLAQFIYNDSKICELFSKRAWVSVSEDFDLARVTRTIIESISRKPCAFSELTILQEILMEKICGISLFLVLDDVWNENRSLWECFRVAFNGAKTVRILTTTRNASVAKVMQTSASLSFNLRCLPEDKCWSLFYQFAFESREGRIQENLLKIGRDIIRKCKGLPLAIKVLGGILRYEVDEDKWLEVLERNISDIPESSEILPALWLSYQKLPWHLRPCFLYLSIFPKGTGFVKDQVIMLWGAQGYIISRPNKTFDELGNEYFNELQCRSLVNVYCGSSYVLHDLIHDLARYIYERESWPNLGNDQTWSSSCKLRHLYLTQKDELTDIMASNDCRTIRTLINFSPSSYAICHSVLSENACLRALKVNLHFELPDVIGTLKHLRYLYIVGKEKNKLPESICLLYNLQILGCWSISVLPENIKNLINLRSLRLSSHNFMQLPESICLLNNLDTLTLSRCGFIMLPSGIGKLTNLRTLNGHFHVVGDGMIAGLGELKDINKLSGLLYISGLRNIADVDYSRMANLASKPNLNELILNFKEDHKVAKSRVHNVDRSSFLDFRKDFDVRGSSWFKLKSVEKRDVFGCRGKVLCLAVGSSQTAEKENNENIHKGVLESLQPHNNIGALEIYNYEGTKFPSWLLYPSLMSTQSSRINFVSLEVLSFSDMPELVEWEAHDGYFPCLRILTISKCPKLWKVSIPQKVKVLQIKGCGCEEIKFSSLSEIEHILISDCRQLFSIHYKIGDLNALSSIQLSSCPNLVMFLAIMEESMRGTRYCGFEEIKSSLESAVQNSLKSHCRDLIWDEYMNGYSPVPGRVSLSHCPKIRSFSAIPLKSDVLEIRGCGFHDIMFPSGCRRVVISDCQGLNSVHWNDGGLSGFNQIVTFANCPQLKILRITKEVEELSIDNCGVHEIILPSQFRIVAFRIFRCKNLISLPSLKDLPLIRQFSIRDCPQFHEVLTIPCYMENLEIIGCSFSEICILPQSKLRKLKIAACEKLTSIEGLQVMRNLEISACPILQFHFDIVLNSRTETILIYKCPKMDFGNQQEFYNYQRGQMSNLE